ncbi:MAG: hypothetical protein OXH14_17045 [Alphaproteobacteria bacterium]|nr:hypothetical protein [Alphaproteobacteria bacterium]
MTVELPGQPPDLDLADSPLAGAADIPAMRARRTVLQEAIEAQGERVTAAEGIVADRRQALAEAEDVQRIEAGALAHLRQGEDTVAKRIEAKRNEERADRDARERTARQEEAARQRAIEDGLIAVGRQEAERRAG